MRKSAHMLRVGMTAVINGSERKITGIEKNDDTRVITITCGDDEFRRTYGVKIDVVKNPAR